MYKAAFFVGQEMVGNTVLVDVLNTNHVTHRYAGIQHNRSEKSNVQVSMGATLTYMASVLQLYGSQNTMEVSCYTFTFT